MLIEQTIYTSARTERSAGYQIIASSPGVSREDLRELTVWGPSHDSLLDDDPGATSINFHPLPSGCYCISKTQRAGAEYSARRGEQIYTQCLVVPAEILTRFGNNPFAVITAVRAQGALAVHTDIPESLDPFRLCGRASAFDRRAVDRLGSVHDGRRLAALVHAALEADAVALAGSENRGELIAGLINCLPPACRTAFSFTTGLKFSPRRPFRIFGISADAARQRAVLRRSKATILDANNSLLAGDSIPRGWARFVHLTITAGRTKFLAAKLADLSVESTPADIDEFGERLANEISGVGGLDRSPGEAVIATSLEDAVSGRAKTAVDTRPLPVPEQAGNESWPRQPAGETCSAASVQETPAELSEDCLAYPRLARDTDYHPARWLGVACPEALDDLETLDDMVFNAISGHSVSLSEIASLWSQVKAQVGGHLIEESREQYVQHAIRVWRDCVQGDDVHDPATAIRAMEVVSLLFVQ